MRIVYFGNGFNGLRVLRFLKEEGENVVGVVVHPPEKARNLDEILETSKLFGAEILEAGELRVAVGSKKMMALSPDLGISINFGYLLPRKIVSLFPKGSINLHTSYLPYNRGSHPNVWAIVEGAPAGVTLHYIDEGADTGAIIAQREVSVLWTDTGKSLHHRLEDAAFQLFTGCWPDIRAGKAASYPQPPGGSFHRDRDFDPLRRVDLEAQYSARDLINRLRALTFPPYDGAYFDVDGRRVYVRVELYEKHE